MHHWRNTRGIGFSLLSECILLYYSEPYFHEFDEMEERFSSFFSSTVHENLHLSNKNRVELNLY